jgi:hypothetical protein
MGSRGSKRKEGTGFEKEESWSPGGCLATPTRVPERERERDCREERKAEEGEEEGATVGRLHCSALDMVERVVCLFACVCGKRDVAWT